MADSTKQVSTPRVRVHRERRKRGDRIVRMRLTVAEIHELKCNGYLTADVDLNMALEAYASDHLAADIEARRTLIGAR